MGKNESSEIKRTPIREAVKLRLWGNGKEADAKFATNCCIWIHIMAMMLILPKMPIFTQLVKQDQDMLMI